MKGRQKLQLEKESSPHERERLSPAIGLRLPIRPVKRWRRSGMGVFPHGNSLLIFAISGRGHADLSLEGLAKGHF